MICRLPQLLSVLMRKAVLGRAKILCIVGKQLISLEWSQWDVCVSPPNLCPSLPSLFQLSVSHFFPSFIPLICSLLLLLLLPSFSLSLPLLSYYQKQLLENLPCVQSKEHEWNSSMNIFVWTCHLRSRAETEVCFEEGQLAKELKFFWFWGAGLGTPCYSPVWRSLCSLKRLGGCSLDLALEVQNLALVTLPVSFPWPLCSLQRRWPLTSPLPSGLLPLPWPFMYTWIPLFPCPGVTQCAGLDSGLPCSQSWALTRPRHQWAPLVPCSSGIQQQLNSLWIWVHCFLSFVPTIPSSVQLLQLWVLEILGYDGSGSTLMTLAGFTCGDLRKSLWGVTIEA